MYPLIQVQGLRHVYSLGDGSQVVALDGIDLTVQRGEFVALIGANGSGKSTLAHHLNALLLPTSGQVWVDGMLTSDRRHTWAVRQRVGMVFQNPDNQFVASTVEEDVAFGLENQARPPAEIRRRVDAALALVGLAGYATHPPQMLSGGQRQLVAIAGALAVQPACIVFDEPTSMLDPLGRHQVLQTIRRMNAEQGLTAILITHSMAEASMALRVVAMHAGRIVLDGTPRKVLEQREQLHTLRLGASPVIEVAHRLREQGVALPAGLLTVEELVEALC